MKTKTKNRENCQILTGGQESKCWGVQKRKRLQTKWKTGKWFYIPRVLVRICRQIFSGGGSAQKVAALVKKANFKKKERRLKFKLSQQTPYRFSCANKWNVRNQKLIKKEMHSYLNFYYFFTNYNFIRLTQQSGKKHSTNSNSEWIARARNFLAFSFERA